jgi:hypothetical protein
MLNKRMRKFNFEMLDAELQIETKFDSAAIGCFVGIKFKANIEGGPSGKAVVEYIVKEEVGSYFKARILGKLKGQWIRSSPLDIPCGDPSAN